MHNKEALAPLPSFPEEANLTPLHAYTYVPRHKSHLALKEAHSLPRGAYLTLAFEVHILSSRQPCVRGFDSLLKDPFLFSRS